MTLYNDPSVAFNISVQTYKYEASGGILGLIDFAAFKMTEADFEEGRVLQLVYVDSAEDFDTFEFKLRNQDLTLRDEPAWRVGNTVTLSFGYASFMRAPQKFVITDIVGFDTLTIKCKELTSLANTERLASYQNLTLMEVIKKVVADSDELVINEFVFETDLKNFSSFRPGDGPIELVNSLQQKSDYTQSGETDWGFILRLAERYGYSASVENKTLHFSRHQTNRRPYRTYTWYTGNGELLKFHLDTAAAVNVKEHIVLKGYNPITREEIQAIGSDETTSRTILGNKAVGSPKKTAKSADEAKKSTEARISFKERTSRFLRYAEKTYSAKINQSDLKKEADGNFRKAALMSTKARALILGDPGLAARRVIEIKGISKRYSGKYYITKNTHTISGTGGYTCSLDLLKNAVVDTDPDNLGLGKENLKKPAKGIDPTSIKFLEQQSLFDIQRGDN